ncbi:serine racemase isoform X1 [Xenopus tropicalis]|uniref:L-serine ammonia-lyase n=1 Tax=Xenopus tropicalis TaxID=8364 RepID=A0A8J0SEF7_XENTR|nr:serine racemase isoform X1 [Xenopus tropicalis]|eukprot:XP_012811884.1 PREDICTED: serine racemase isoform X2 [Xenopus tropicalis]
MSAKYCITLKDVQDAQANIQGLIHTTPIITSSSLNALAGRKLFFKCELLQKTGSFKIRGALNAVKNLPANEPVAVVTHSSGNHGQALALAAQMRGIPAHVVVPRTAASCKKAAISAYGAQIIECEPNDKVPEIEALVVPVGGGGMLAGITIAAKAIKPEVKIFAAEPLNADDCYRSKINGQLTPNLKPPTTIADSVKTSIGPNTWPIIRDLVDDVLVISEEEIKAATRLVWERLKLLIEPTAGLGLAAVLTTHFQEVAGNIQNIGVVLCGGNIDLASAEWLHE